MSRTYSLAEVAEDLCGDSSKQSLRWVADQIRAKRFPAVKSRGHWRMSDDDIAVALKVCSNGAKQPESTEPRVLSFTPTSARRVAS